MKRASLFALIALFVASAQQPSPDNRSAQDEYTYANLRQGQVINGFRAVSVYLDENGHPMGARFRQVRSGFTLDLLNIQSVPQAFIWVTTYPVSNMGEPHTQEHLLLGKGNKGRELASQEPLSLVSSSAFTMQWMTCFHFYTVAGPEVFYEHFERVLDALIHPDYTDEEIRREVRNFGISSAPDGKLRLEEKGTVYNEMTTSMDRQVYRLFRAAALAAYGPEHPLAFSAGGLPEGLRIIQPADIRRFHASHYFGGNMGMIVAVPKEIKLEVALARIDAALDRVEPRHPVLPLTAEDDLPAAKPAQPGRIEYVPYPFRNQQQPSSVILLWPADRKLDNRGYERLSLFLDTFAGDSDTNLYRLLIDTRTRQADFGIRGVDTFVSSDAGHPVYIVFRDVPPARMNDPDLGAMRNQVLEELARIAAYPDSSLELAAFNSRFKSRVIERRRKLAKFVHSPPQFGFRGTGPSWVMHLYQLSKEPGFQKSLTETEELKEIENLASGTRNVWRDYLTEWKLTGVTPWIEAAKPDPELLRQEEAKRADRIAAETARLKQRYRATDDQEALRRFQADEEAAAKALEAAAWKLKPPAFIDNPPLTLDDGLEFHTSTLPGGVPLVSSTFEGMPGATAGIALRLESIPEDQLVFVSMLPQLLTRAGVIENGKPVPYQEMAGRLRKEILNLDAGLSVNPVTGRYELVVRASGNNLAESQRAVEWINLVLFHPDWRSENLPRLRDLVEQTLGALRSTTQAPEEQWVEDPARAWRWQTNPLFLATSSFMTREHNVFRLKWMLQGKGEDSASRDIQALLAEGPESSRKADQMHLMADVAQGLAAGPEKTLAALERIRRSLLITGGARMFLISSPSIQAGLTARLRESAGLLENRRLSKATYKPGRRIEERLRGRDPGAGHPLFVGFVNANSQGGVFLNSAPGASYKDTSPHKLLDFIASNLYAGHGAHGIFMKTWSAGLAYSNGIRVRPLEGTVNYYAERTPLLPQTLQFVIGELKKARPNPSLVDYAIAGAFEGTRSALPYEDRGEAMANDLADGLPPQIVARFHRAILQLRRRPDLISELFRRMAKVYERILPGMGVSASEVRGGVYFVIGPERQLRAYEEYLQKVESASTRLFRLYARDFWLD